MAKQKKNNHISNNPDRYYTNTQNQPQKFVQEIPKKSVQSSAQGPKVVAKILILIIVITLATCSLPFVFCIPVLLVANASQSSVVAFGAGGFSVVLLGVGLFFLCRKIARF